MSTPSNSEYIPSSSEDMVIKYKENLRENANTLLINIGIYENSLQVTNKLNFPQKTALHHPENESMIKNTCDKYILHRISMLKQLIIYLEKVESKYRLWYISHHKREHPLINIPKFYCDYTLSCE